MILFCQYVIDICTLPTSNNKECKGPLCLYQRSEVNQSYLERSAKVSGLLHIHKAVFYPCFSFPYSIAATVLPRVQYGAVDRIRVPMILI